MKLHHDPWKADTSQNILCIYHNDLDGYCAGHIVHTAIWAPASKPNTRITYKELNYPDKYDLDKIKTYDQVIIVDFSLPMQHMQELNECVDLIWIDHHASAINDACAAGLSDIKGLRRVGTAGCQLAWEYYYPKLKMPLYVELLGDFDVWKKDDQQRWQDVIVPFQFYCLANKKKLKPNAHAWNTLPPEWEPEHARICKAGKAILAFQENMSTDACTSFAFTTEIEGYRAIVLNTSGIGSGQFHSVPKDDYEIMCVYRWNGERYTFSLYSELADIDCGAICKKFGGGGHKGAAGFSADTLPWTTTKRWVRPPDASLKE